MLPRLSQLQGHLLARYGVKSKLTSLRCVRLRWNTAAFATTSSQNVKKNQNEGMLPSKHLKQKMVDNLQIESDDSKIKNKSTKQSFSLESYLSDVKKGKDVNSMPHIPLDYLKGFRRFNSDEEPEHETESNETEVNETEWRTVEDSSQLPQGVLESIEERDPENEILYANRPESTAVACLSDVEKATLKKLFRFLELGKKKPVLFRRDVWKIFPTIASQTPLVKTLNMIAWDRMWSFENQEIPSPRRIVLGEVMIKHDIDMTEEQFVKFVEALFWYGRRDDAMTIWKAQRDYNSTLTWWNLGIRMAATENNPVQAGKWAEKAYKITGVYSAMTFLPVIVSYLHAAEEAIRSSDNDSFNRYTSRAMGFYKRLKEAKTEITHKQYTRVAMSCLDAGLFDKALEVHYDMIQDHTKFMDLKSEFFQRLHQSTISTNDSKYGPTTQNPLALKNVDSVVLSADALRSLDPKEKQIVLFEHWVRYLIHRKHFIAVMIITNAMLQQNYLFAQRRSWVYHEVLKSFSKQGRRENMSILGSAMIEEIMKGRFEQSQISSDTINRCQQLLSVLRSQVNSNVPGSQAFHRLKPDEPSSRDTFELFLQNVPPASEEAFKILLRTYLELGKMEKVNAVIYIMSTLRIPPSIQILNVCMQTFFNKKRLEEIPVIYLDMVTRFPDHIRPNEKTIRILFKVATGRGKQVPGAMKKTITEPRSVFAEMVKYQGQITYTHTLYNHMCRAFCQALDIHGLFVAIMACHRHYGLKPTVFAARSLTYIHGVTSGKSSKDSDAFATSQHLAAAYFEGVDIARKRPLSPVKRSRWAAKLKRYAKKDPSRYNRLKEVIQRFTDEENKTTTTALIEEVVSEPTKSGNDKYVPIQSISDFYVDMFLNGKFRADKHLKPLEKAMKDMNTGQLHFYFKPEKTEASTQTSPS